MPQLPQRTNSLRRSAMIGALLGCVGLAVAGMFLTNMKPKPDFFEKVSTEATPPPPFQELTIPYLRSRTYQSTLSELKRVAETSMYTSYLTSYTSDGLRINGLLTQPKGPQPADGWPAVVFVHGYIPPTLYKTQEKYVEYVNALARSGIVVFKIDLRGHGDSEGTPSGSYYSSGYVIDTLNAVVSLESADFVNKMKIGLWGHSMAGNIVLRSLAVRPQTPAAVMWAGAGFTYVDLQKYGLNDNSYRPPQPSGQPNSERQRMFQAHGQFSSESEFWRQVAPTNYLAGIEGAIQLHHAQDDTVVNAGYSQDLAKLLQDMSVPHEVFIYPTGGHNLTGSSFTKAMQRTVSFYQKRFTD